VFVELETLNQTVSFYSKLTAGSQTLPFEYPEAELTLAAVSSPHLSVLAIAGPPIARQRFEATLMTIRVDNLDSARRFLEAEGAAIIEQPKPVPTGRNMRARHRDGLVVEHVEHRSEKPHD
jgi:predicted enzyme related to lactoylglutathione lyase